MHHNTRLFELISGIITACRRLAYSHLDKKERTFYNKNVNYFLVGEREKRGSWFGFKADYGLEHGHANVIAQILTKPNTGNVTPDDKIAKLFSGKKEQWRQLYDNLLANLNEFGTDVGVAVTSSYISLLRGSKKFGIVQPTNERLDIGNKLKDAAPTERFEAAESWNNMVTHRVRISDPTQVDADVLVWLKQPTFRSENVRKNQF